MQPVAQFLATIAAKDAKIELLLQDCGSIWKSLYHELSATSRAQRDALKAEVERLTDAVRGAAVVTNIASDEVARLKRIVATLANLTLTRDDAPVSTLESNTEALNALIHQARAALTPAKETEHG